MLEVKGVHMIYPVAKRYKEIITQPFKNNFKHALNNINMNVQLGDRIAFLGANGAGKTSLLKLIGGLLLPTKGNILINNYDTALHNLEARKSVGFILNEERSFYWRLTGKQNLAFFGTLDNIYGKQLKSKVDNLISVVGLESAADSLVGTYSSGMKQRLAIARGLLSDPKILVLDEPTRTLDPIAAEEIKQLLNKIYSEDDRILLIATHNLEEADTLCNRICIMKKGYVIVDEELKDIKQKTESLYKYYESIHTNNTPL